MDIHFSDLQERGPMFTKCGVRITGMDINVSTIQRAVTCPACLQACECDKHGATHCPTCWTVAS